MSRYLAAFADFMRTLEQVTKDEQDARRRVIMQNYTRHHAVELSGNYREIFTPQMSIALPVYHVRLFTPGVTTYVGEDQLRSLYQLVDAYPLVLTDPRIAVSDWGVAAHEHLVLLFPGHAAGQLGIEVDEPDATYVRECEIANFCPYDADAKLIGEDIYQLTVDTVAKADPADVFTLAQRAEIARPFADV